MSKGGKIATGILLALCAAGILYTPASRLIEEAGEKARLSKVESRVTKDIQELNLEDAVETLAQMEWRAKSHRTEKSTEWEKKRADYREQLKAVWAEGAQKNFEKWYTPDADIIVGQKYISVEVDEKTGKLSARSRVVYEKTGLTSGGAIYTVDTKERKINSTYADGETFTRYYFPDGSVRYWKDGKYWDGQIREGATFNAEQASEVIGKTFSGAWSNNFRASITFGRNGRATVRFNDGDTASGAYYASDEDNIVVLNYKDRNELCVFRYSDSDNKVSYVRYFPNKDDEGVYSIWQLGTEWEKQ